MTSKYIYHYVYRITNIIEKKHYYGKRSSKIEPKLDLGFKYFGSPSGKTNSWIVKDQKENPSSYRYKIIRICDSAAAAHKLETKLHNRCNVAKNENFYNEVKTSYTNSLGFNPSEKAFVVDKNNEKYYVYRDDERIKSGELFYPNKGMVIVKDHTGFKFRVELTDPRYISGELVHQNKGLPGNLNQKLAASKASSSSFPIVDMMGDKYRIPINTPGYGVIYKHVATKEILYQEITSGNTFWGTTEYLENSLFRVLYYNKGKSTKFIYYTPWGTFNSVREANISSPRDFGYQNIKIWCRKYETKINSKFSPKLLNFFNYSILGMSFKEIGFYRSEVSK
jgi:hypothetical protein